MFHYVKRLKSFFLFIRFIFILSWSIYFEFYVFCCFLIHRDCSHSFSVSPEARRSFWDHALGVRHHAEHPRRALWLDEKLGKAREITGGEREKYKYTITVTGIETRWKERHNRTETSSVFGFISSFNESKYPAVVFKVLEYTF